MSEERTQKLPPGLTLEQLYVSTGEDKGDDVNFIIGISFGPAERDREYAFNVLRDWLDEERCSALLGSPCEVQAFPAARVLNILCRGRLLQAGYDKQGKGIGRALLARLGHGTLPG